MFKSNKSDEFMNMQLYLIESFNEEGFCGRNILRMMILDSLNISVLKKFLFWDILFCLSYFRYFTSCLFSIIVFYNLVGISAEISEVFLMISSCFISIHILLLKYLSFIFTKIFSFVFYIVTSGVIPCLLVISRSSFTNKCHETL